MTYTIKQGEHYCKPRKWGLGWSQEYHYKVTFNDSCKYDIGEDGYDISKLCGRGYFSGDSARFGWRYWDGKLELLAYVHDNGVVIKKKIRELIINLEYEMKLTIGSDLYTFYCEGQTQYVARTHTKKMSFPRNFYFGGNLTAPHDISVKIT